MNPLEQLQDIALPEKIHGYPVAYGWWLLVIILFLAITLSIVFAVKHHQRNKAKKQALKALKTSSLTTEQTLSLLKWSCLAYFPRADVASLYGESFQEFLVKQLPLTKKEAFTRLCKDNFNTLYQAKTSAQEQQEQQGDDAIKILTKFWLTHALPPKSINQKNYPIQSDTIVHANSHVNAQQATQTNEYISSKNDDAQHKKQGEQS